MSVDLTNIDCRNINFVVFWLLAHAKYFNKLPGYMERFILCRFGRTVDAEGKERYRVAIRLHHILRSDTDPDRHDHPWSFLTLILAGGYFEELHVEDEEGVHVYKKWRGPGTILFRRPQDAHRVLLEEGQTAWTLFIHGKKRQDWGFHTLNGWVHNQVYFKERGYS